MRMWRVAVAGASGYAGGEILRLLLAHPHVEIGALTAHGNAGERVTHVHPHLRPLADRRLEPTTPEVLHGHDIVILALPHGASGPLAAMLDPGTLVLDCGADHRLERSDDWAAFYGGEHPGTWAYGLPELVRGWTPAGPIPRQRATLSTARRIAVPGCNVTAVTLALAPGIAAGLIEPADLVAVLANGVSGAGKSPKTHLLASEILGGASPYAVAGTHRHIPEILQNFRAAAGRPPNLGAEPSISFTPVLVPMARGILASTSARLAAGVDPGDLRHAWRRAYGEERFVTLLPEGEWPNTHATLGANTAHVQVAYDPGAGRVLAIAALDNLVKGTAGAAVQSMNIALGLSEETALTTIGLAP
ncbi:MAG: N-acetyl-gamma-glutamyl-phosphate reductase [Bifidobacteriaceae bacterium]|jgi:N-acetyl-gamma-glutamyl-phosphate reductase|nr:N-acetyl-gamma-glutamyl-phosphate reductase [Bifidobacteriaceae bacterium]